MEWKNKTVIITGGNKGIGAAVVSLFLEAGARVAILDRDAESGFETIDSLFYSVCDVSVESEVEQAMDAVYARFGSIDILVNNAGIQRYGTVTETSAALWDEVMSVNLRSYFLCCHYALPYMMKNGSGIIINVSSVQAFHSQPKVAAYTTAKTALLGLTRSIAVDYAPAIRCIAICPGTIDTPMLRDAILESPVPDAVMKECEEMHLLQRVGKPEEVAELIRFVCDDKAAFMTGQAIRIDGGLGIVIQGSKND